MSDENLVEAPSMAERKATRKSRIDAAAETPAMLQGEELAAVRKAARAVNENEGRPIGEVIRCKVRVRPNQGHPPFLTFTADQVPDRASVGKKFVYGNTVYLRREAFEALRRTGMIERGD